MKATKEHSDGIGDLMGRKILRGKVLDWLHRGIQSSIFDFESKDTENIGA